MRMLSGADRDRFLEAGRLAARARDYGRGLVVEGARFLDVAGAVEDLIRKSGGEPAFPVNLSVNEQAAHYTPHIADASVFRRGDVVKLDCGVHVDGFIGDTAVTVEVGTDTRASLLGAAREALKRAVGMVKGGLELSVLGGTIEATIQTFGYRPVANLTGHSLERYEQHAGISVPNVPRGEGRLETGMVVAVEPFSTDGAGRIEDGGPGNIYHFHAPKPQRDPYARDALEYIRTEHADLPFASRWLAAAVPPEKVEHATRLLLRSGAISSYGILVEVAGGMVAQAEHTLIVTDEGCEVTTL
ncbi:MAG: type II methionyl aminopeptidase [Methanobacteriota archaeon]